MLSHLRFHRRAPSNPSSPLPEQAPSWDAVAQQREHPHSRPTRAPCDVSPRPDARPRSPNSSQLPPTLPPITRVASTGSSDHFFTPPGDAPPPSQDARHPQARPGRDDNNSGFIGGAALRNQRKASQSQPGPDAGTPVAGQLPENQLSRATPRPPPINTTGATARPPISGGKQSKTSWFSTPTDLQGTGGLSKRPSGPRIASDSAASLASEPQKGRKGLPFLKNPMSSLLMRRKAAQAPVETQPPAPSYDPRIKGTRVHDFSAPRPRKTVSPTAVSATKQEPAQTAPGPTAPGQPAAATPEDGLAAHSPAEPPAQDTKEAPRDGEAGAGSQGPQGGRLPSSTSPPVQPGALASPNDGSSLYTSASAASEATQVGPLQPMPSASASVKTTASRQLSAASKRNSAASAIPKHMKSTSSRFSFDMIGAAEQERVLEERHRQRQQERKMSDDPDARFDDFDEEFDYDAMMDDDGLEEKVPGVNADYDERDEYGEGPEAALDPDKDQENFAGFVFQRSNPASSLTSPLTPGMAPTPRDASGNVIGLAMTNATPTTADLPMSAGPPGLPQQGDTPAPDATSSAQGAREAQDKSVSQSTCPAPANPPPPPPLGLDNDDIYYDDGLADELDFEHDGTAFDESIFDIDDTDQFGRPIPGAFAQAKEAMQAAQRNQASNRNSNLTTSTSGQSGAAQSTGQTSLSVGPQQPLGQPRGLDDEPSSPQRPPQPAPGIPSQDLAYQAALAEAAQKAAASGKFKRSSSPETLAGLTDERLGDDGLGPDGVGGASGYIDDYNDGVANDFDDFDFDDEAIIAEANASALANDSEGFYGQEFGFYSAPIPQPHHGSHHQASGSKDGLVTTESLFQYANGGYFGPASAALNRSTSGRAVREPNLTPITERSEYSNRNSVMSFTLPPAIGSSGGSDRNSLTSPGLAQLAMLPADDADASMSLSALMKLRSRAWGGSQASLVSSSREGSPRSERAPPASTMSALDNNNTAAGGAGAGSAGSASSSPYGAPVPAHLAGHVRVNSGLSLWSCSEAAEEEEEEKETAGAAAAGGCGGGSNGVMLPPRPGSAGAILNGAGGGAGGAGGTNGPMLTPLPQRPQSLFLPQVASPLGSQQQQVGLAGSVCSPVLEGEEGETEADAGAEGNAGCARGFALAPALPLRTKKSPSSRSRD
ncbi:uncharacterized protein P884DRAFT_265392 [Thermothelomyces heterothallicus CBS 202.75]|uniref:uncharacterized protein n=1 Tax=Thermothelomyces heterothallicus CBS 202.75 TaxID=1149848 RepID=UPI003741EE7E